MQKIQIAHTDNETVYATIYHSDKGLAVEKSPYSARWGVVHVLSGKVLGTCRNFTRKAARVYQQQLQALAVDWTVTEPQLSGQAQQRIKELYSQYGHQ
jgi:hypothetical protein